jgi:hypothetical protein
MIGVHVGGASRSVSCAVVAGASATRVPPSSLGHAVGHGGSYDIHWRTVPDLGHSLGRQQGEFRASACGSRRRCAGRPVRRARRVSARHGLSRCRGRAAGCVPPRHGHRVCVYVYRSCCTASAPRASRRGTSGPVISRPSTRWTRRWWTRDWSARCPPPRGATTTQWSRRSWRSSESRPRTVCK